MTNERLLTENERDTTEIQGRIGALKWVLAEEEA